MAKKLQYLLDAEKLLPNLSTIKHTRSAFETKLREYLDYEFEGDPQKQGMLDAKIQTEALSALSLHDWLINNCKLEGQDAYGELALGFFKALENALEGSLSQQGEKSVSAIGWALNRAIKLEKEKAQLSVLSRGPAPTFDCDTHYALHPNMAFGRAKYSRAV